MANAKEEFLRMVRGEAVLCAFISYRDCWEYDSPGSQHALPATYTEEQYNAFVESLDFQYDSGYGGQELFGTVWFKDGTWADRGEYDGSEWREHHVCPAIPNYLIK